MGFDIDDLPWDEWDREDDDYEEPTLCVNCGYRDYNAGFRCSRCNWNYFDVQTKTPLPKFTDLHWRMVKDNIPHADISGWFNGGNRPSWRFNFNVLAVSVRQYGNWMTIAYVKDGAFKQFCKLSKEITEKTWDSIMEDLRVHLERP